MILIPHVALFYCFHIPMTFNIWENKISISEELSSYNLMI